MSIPMHLESTTTKLHVSTTFSIALACRISAGKRQAARTMTSFSPADSESRRLMQ